MDGSPRVAVIGHVEWVEFASTDRLPARGEVAHASVELEEPAGGGAVAAVQVAKLAGTCDFRTALGRDELAPRATERLADLGVEVDAQRPQAKTRRALTLVDAGGERTIITLGPRLEPSGAELAPLGRAAGAYFTAGDADALRALRGAAAKLVLTPRAARAASTAGVPIDVLVYSAGDPIETRLAPQLEPLSAVVLRTLGSDGGEWAARDGSTGRWDAALPPAPARDTYGCGDTFAAGVTYGLAAGARLDEVLALAARCAATCLAGRGPYERLLAAADL